MAQLAEALVRKGHQVHVLTSGNRDLSPFETHNGVNIYRARVLFRHRLDVATQISMYSYFPSSLWTGWRKIDPENIDLINTHFAIPSGPTGVLLARWWKKPHVLTTHGGDIYDPSKKLSPHKFWPLRKVVRWVLNRSDRVTTDFQDIAERTRSIYGYSKPVQVIPYRLPVAAERKPNRNHLGWPKEQFILVSLARLIPRKGFNYLIESLAGFKDKNWRWILLGSGPLKNALCEQAAQSGIRDRIDFKGYVDEETKSKILSSADLFVLPSLHEGFGVVNQEAMAYGLPIVTTSVGGQIDFLKNEVNALLVPPGDVNALSDALRRMFEDESLRRKIGATNRREMLSGGFEKWVNQYEDLFLNLISGRKL